ncbi:DUF6221 family protein [Nocardia flavorosea]|uniref:Uncharacterized protein n=1 Tax=Nocardia flavorosea TaxID=53429 RepID=A0A846YL70_9NOCA|nr:DUF6221 family protein [Nocardia flavorosea]NKY60386.1 hypothetical protein [Nocardia flavorosea]
MTSIEEFIEARLGEDERIARAAFLAGTPTTAQWSADAPEVRSADSTLVVKHTWPKEAEHIARHDPARALQMCRALRCMIASLRLAHYIDDDTLDETLFHDDLRPLARVWRAHEDFDPEWEWAA